MRLHRLLLLLPFIVIQNPNQVICDGTIEVELLTYQNPARKDASGHCCVLQCDQDCQNQFSFCFFTNESAQSTCQGGKVTKKIFSDSTIFRKGRNALGPNMVNPFKWKFSGAWNGTLNLSVVINHQVDKRNRQHIFHIDELKLRVADAKLSSDWSTALVSGKFSKRLKMKWRVRCRTNFYGDCKKYCKAKDSDEEGHYKCSTDGDKICRSRWTGAACKQAVSPCKGGFHKCKEESGAFCADSPGGYDCLCKHGYRQRADAKTACEFIRCPSLKFRGPVRANFSDFRRGHQSTVSLLCLNNLKQVGNGTLVCDLNGRWRGKVPRCVGVSLPTTTTKEASWLKGWTRVAFYAGGGTLLLLLGFVVGLCCWKRNRIQKADLAETDVKVTAVFVSKKAQTSMRVSPAEGSSATREEDLQETSEEASHVSMAVITTHNSKESSSMEERQADDWEEQSTPADDTVSKEEHTTTHQEKTTADDDNNSTVIPSDKA